MTMSLINLDAPTNGSDACEEEQLASKSCNESYLMEMIQRFSIGPSRQLSSGEKELIEIINSCFKNWYKPWRENFLNNGDEFVAVYDLMEGLLHYEQQITKSETTLSNDRSKAIAHAVTRLVDYGNAILNIDLVLRVDNETEELDSSSVTTIELYQAHIRAQKLRDKLMQNYFRRDKRDSTSGQESEINSAANNCQPSINNTSPLLLQAPTTKISNSCSPTMQRSPRLSIGSSATSINTLVAEGRRTPRSLSPQPQQIELRAGSANAYRAQVSIEVKHMTATIQSSSFSDCKNVNTRRALLPGVLAKIDSLLTVPTSAEKLTNCFELLDALLVAIERLPTESRAEEVTTIVDCLLKQIVRKVHVDDREELVEFQHSRWTTYLLSLVRLMTVSDFNSYLRNFTNLVDLRAFLQDYLSIIRRLIISNGGSSELYNTNSQSSHLDASIQDGPINTIFPDSWVEMSLLVCSTFLKSLIYLYQVLKQCFATNLQMWTSYIDCLVHFMLQNVLKPARPMFKQFQTALANDVRKTAAEYIWISWDSLGGDQKEQIYRDLIVPLIRVCILINSRQRFILLPIFYDMMRCDYTSQYVTPKHSPCGGPASVATLSPNFSQRQSEQSQVAFIYEDDFENFPPVQASAQANLLFLQQQPQALRDQLPQRELLPYLELAGSCTSEDGTVLTKFTHLIVGELYTLMMEHGLGDEQFMVELCSALSGELNSNNTTSQQQAPSRGSESNYQPIDSGKLQSMAKHTSNLIAEFMQICLDSQQANQLSYNHLYLLCLFKLTLFFRDKVDRVELYLKSLHKLWCRHHNSGRFVEAGFTLLDYAKTISWSEKPLEAHHRTMTDSFRSPEPLSDHSSLRTFLYTTIIEYFDQGQLWEAAMPLCRELIDIYQFKTFEYIKLAATLSKLASYVSKIAEGNLRTQPEYFRVSFFGHGFPKCIRNATMVYRGKPYEKLSEFQATILNKYSGASLLNSLAKPDESLISDSNAKYLQINACSPIVDLKMKFNNLELTKVDESILSYYKHNECDKFQFSRRVNRTGGGDNDDSFANMWRERTTLTTNSLPGMLPFFLVYLTETSIVSPIESAIEDLERTNDRLFCMVNRFKVDKRQEEDVRSLGQLLLGVVDAAVNGGITKYEEAFFGLAATRPPPPILNTPSAGSMRLHAALPSSGGPARASNGLQRGAGGNNSSNDANADYNDQVATAAALIDPARAIQVNNVDKSGFGGGGVANQPPQPSQAQVDKLKCSIARQVPLLDEAIRLHRDRVADVMRPQHEHLEASYKKLKHHIMSKYSRYLPQDYTRSSLRSYRSLAGRSPNRSLRSESRLSAALGGVSCATTAASSPQSHRGRSVSLKRKSDVGSVPSASRQHFLAAAACPLSPLEHNLAEQHQNSASPTESTTTIAEATNIPYKLLSEERRSLPFLTGTYAAVGRAIFASRPPSGTANNCAHQRTESASTDQSTDKDEASDSNCSDINLDTPVAKPRHFKQEADFAGRGEEAPYMAVPPIVSDLPYVCVTDLMQVRQEVATPSCQAQHKL